MNEKKTPAGKIALGGFLAALAVAVMSLGTLIPVMTYVCPMICTLILEAVRQTCGNRIGWAWYGAVAFLGALLSPDKEAALMFVFLGYYPLVRPKITGRLSWVYKLLLFNGSIGVMYFLLLQILGVQALVEEYREMGVWMLAALVVMGNVTFFLLDTLLHRASGKWVGRK